MSLKLIVFSWKLLTASPHPSPNICLFLPSGAWGPGETKIVPYDNGVLVQLTSDESKARILS